MNFKSTSVLFLSAIAVAPLFFTSSCKKDNNSSTLPSGIAFSVNGSAFTSTRDSAVYEQGIGIMQVIGYDVTGSDSTAFEVAFYDSLTLKKEYNIKWSDSPTFAELIWTDFTTNYSTLEESSHGTLTLITYDQTNKKISGKFSGVLYSSTGKDSLKITGGTFSTTYTTL